MFPCFFFFSPKLNQNLLTRSEVVALMNTLHRWTESLVAVSEFRRMWAKEEHAKQGILLESVEGAAKVCSLSSRVNATI